MKLVLIGLRGSGKTTVGKLAAARLGWPFADTDVIIQQRAGISIREIFQRDGEKGFRRLEAAVVQEYAAQDHIVIASGGGAVLDPANTAALRQNGLVVHLTAAPRELWARVSQDQKTVDTRPKLLQETKSGLEELERIAEARAAVYSAARHVEVSVAGRTPEDIADEVILLHAAAERRASEAPSPCPLPQGEGG
jgi:shikimate kinase